MAHLQERPCGNEKKAIRTGAFRAGTQVRHAIIFGFEFQMMKNNYMAYPSIFLAIFMAIFIPNQALPLDASGIPSGQNLFKEHCSSCHGDEAVGQDPSQPQGGWDDNNNRLAPALNGTGHAWHHPPSLLFQYIKDGSIDQASPMPAFGDQLNDDEIQSIIGYIQSMWSDEIMNKYIERFKDEKE